jgi:hypothetical protein
MRTEELTDEHIKQQHRFLGLPEPTAEECRRLRAFCLWKRENLAPETLREADRRRLGLPAKA